MNLTIEAATLFFDGGVLRGHVDDAVAWSRVGDGLLRPVVVWDAPSNSKLGSIWLMGATRDDYNGFAKS
jgi:hypothetical protein